MNMYERRSFAQSEKVVLRNTAELPQLVNEPTYEPPTYAVCLVDKLPNGSIMYRDSTTILKDVDTYVKKLGLSVVQDLINSMTPSPVSLQDTMSDNERFDVCVSRYCQTISERQQVLNYLQSEHADILEQYKVMTAESAAEPVSTSAPADPS